MKRFIFFVFSCIVLSIPVYSQYNDASFEMPTSNSIILNIDSSIVNNGLLNLNINEAIYGLAVSGTCRLKTKNAFVRILLRDDCNYEHLVYENNELLADSSINAFVNIGIETSLLDSIIPIELRIFLADTDLYISNISYTTTNHYATSSQIQIRRNAQNDAIVSKLNANLAERGMTWRAGTTFISSLSYEEKKTLFGTDTLPNLYGIEYYKGGIYVMPDYEFSKEKNSNSEYVDSFDWRNRHGKNWLTPVKAQGSCGNCWAMAPIDHVESYINLYYNRLLNYDLSEQEIVSCSYEYPSLFNMNNGGCEGAPSSGAYKYIKLKGVVTEDCLPYGDFYYNTTRRVDQDMYTLVHYRDKCKSPSEIIRIEEFHKIEIVFSEDSIKSLVMKQPMTFGLQFTHNGKSGAHCMLMTGFKKIHTGDSICKDYLSDNIIQAPVEMDGTTAYIVKNSWGEDWGDNGYGYLVALPYWLDDISHIYGDIYSEIYTEDSIQCLDADGDGYYFWGIGNSRPSNLPEWAPRYADGDDSNAKYGPINKFGFIEEINPDNKDTIFITEETDWDKENYIWQHIVIKNEGILNIKSNVKFYKGVNIIVENGGQLVVDAGYMENPNIKVELGGELIIKNKGRIKKNKHLTIAQGAKMRIVNGVINQ